MENIVKAGKILVAEPDFVNPIFANKVILICFKDDEGILGLILNDKLPRNMSELTGKPLHSGYPIYFGGPMGESGLMLHRDQSVYTGDQITEGVFMGTDDSFRTLENHILHKDEKQNLARIFVGYAGWTEEQLDAEIKEGNWKVIDSTPEIVFCETPETLWTELSK